jgi:hypothetical protein
MSYLKMLEDEMKASDQFTRENFGLQVGDGYPELVREIVKSDTISARLLLGLVLSGMCGKEVVKSMKEVGDKRDLGNAIVKNLPAFDTPLAFLYWGIQIGRKMERESAGMLDSLDRGV